MKEGIVVNSKIVSVLLLFLSFVISGCNTSEDEIEKEVSPTEKNEEIEVKQNQEIIEVPISNEPINVTLDLEVVNNEEKIEFKGKTNLPNDTEVMISLSNTTGYKAQDNQSVSNNGSFSSGPFSKQGKGLDNGTYTVEVSTPTENVQPENVQKLIGDNGVNLTGSLIESDEVWGNRLKYSETFKIENSTSTNQTSTQSGNVTASDAEIYTYMKSQYDRLTDFGENYDPDVHDDMVAQMAAKKFGISSTEAGNIYIKQEMGGN